MYNSYYRVDNLREHVHDWILTYNFIYDPIIPSDCSGEHLDPDGYFLLSAP